MEHYKYLENKYEPDVPMICNICGNNNILRSGMITHQQKIGCYKRHLLTLNLTPEIVEARLKEWKAEKARQYALRPQPKPRKSIEPKPEPNNDK